MNKAAATLVVSLVLATQAFGMSKKNSSQTAPSIGPATSQSESASADTVWVGKSDLARSCGEAKGIDIDAMGKDLSTHDIKILARKKIPDGKVRIQMCGVDKGDMNGYLIPKKDLDKAKETGFQYIPNVY